MAIVDYSFYKHLSDIKIKNVADDTVIEDYVANSAGAYPSLYAKKSLYMIPQFVLKPMKFMIKLVRLYQIMNWRMETKQQTII
jgi:hypothetical protein